MRITLDSNCFKNQPFIDFLIVNKSEIEIHLSVISYIETLIWYQFRGLDIDDFDSEIEDLNAKIDLLDKNVGKKISEMVIFKNKTFPFKHHARDYFIGVTAAHNDTVLVTYNIRHFDWFPKQVLTPEEFVRSFLDLKE